jgi:hypothetical protein
MAAAFLKPSTHILDNGTSKFSSFFLPNVTQLEIFAEHIEYQKKCAVYTASLNSSHVSGVLIEFIGPLYNWLQRSQVNI